MIKDEKLDAYRKMKLWINELPEDCDHIVLDKVHEYNANNNIHWFTGILCLELRIAPRAASNYAMLNLKFTQHKSSKFQVVYKFCESDEIVHSDIAMPNDVVKKGVIKEYYNTLLHIFDELSLLNVFPSGKLEIMGGRYGSIGSSDIAVGIVLKILLKLFELSDDLEEKDTSLIVLNGCKEKV